MGDPAMGAGVAAVVGLRGDGWAMAFGADAGLRASVAAGKEGESVAGMAGVTVPSKAPPRRVAGSRCYSFG